MAADEHGKKMTVEVVSASGLLWRGHAESVVATTMDGEVGVLRHHEPMLALLAPGEVRITKLSDDGGGVVKAYAEDGFLSVEKTITRIVALRANMVD